MMQSDGITIVDVFDNSMVIRLFVGHVDITLRYQPRFNRFEELSRQLIDGRRALRDSAYLPAGRYKALIKRAHAIAHDHGWKQAKSEAR